MAYPQKRVVVFFLNFQLTEKTGGKTLKIDTHTALTPTLSNMLKYLSIGFFLAVSHHEHKYIWGKEAS